MNAHDWRAACITDVAPLYDTEAARWMATLHWDTRASWAVVEPARAAGILPGLVARDEQGRIRGWTFYLRHEGALQIGAFAADSPEATSTLLHAIAASPEAASASALVFFAFSIAPHLTDELHRRGFAVERYRYLQAGLARPTSRPGPAAPSDADADATPWRDADQFSVAALLARAYPAHDPARPFARSGQPHEWRDYVRQLVTTNGCGVFLPRASFVVPGAEPGLADAATLVTCLAPDTVHVAQVAVSPDARGRGLARRLIAASLQAARDAGYARATLLVSERNLAARHVYDQMGFEETAAFVSAVSDQPRRSTSAALETGGAITLR